MPNTVDYIPKKAMMREIHGLVLAARYFVKKVSKETTQLCHFRFFFLVWTYQVSYGTNPFDLINSKTPVWLPPWQLPAISPAQFSMYWILRLISSPVLFRATWIRSARELKAPCAQQLPQYYIPTHKHAEYDRKQAGRVPIICMSEVTNDDDMDCWHFGFLSFLKSSTFRSYVPEGYADSRNGLHN
jgi:hypothetical protein